MHESSRSEVKDEKWKSCGVRCEWFSSICFLTKQTSHDHQEFQKFNFRMAFLAFSQFDVLIPLLQYCASIKNAIHILLSYSLRNSDQVISAGITNIIDLIRAKPHSKYWSHQQLRIYPIFHSWHERNWLHWYDFPTPLDMKIKSYFYSSNWINLIKIHQYFIIKWSKIFPIWSEQSNVWINKSFQFFLPQKPFSFRFNYHIWNYLNLIMKYNLTSYTANFGCQWYALL